jgi:hypothetical protein
MATVGAADPRPRDNHRPSTRTSAPALPGHDLPLRLRPPPRHGRSDEEELDVFVGSEPLRGTGVRTRAIDSRRPASASVQGSSEALTARIHARQRRRGRRPAALTHSRFRPRCASAAPTGPASRPAAADRPCRSSRTRRRRFGAREPAAGQFQGVGLGLRSASVRGFASRGARRSAAAEPVFGSQSG